MQDRLFNWQSLKQLKGKWTTLERGEKKQNRTGVCLSSNSRESIRDAWALLKWHTNKLAPLRPKGTGVQLSCVCFWTHLVVGCALGLGDELGVADVTVALCEQASVHHCRRLHLHLRLCGQTHNHSHMKLRSGKWRVGSRNVTDDVRVICQQPCL